MALIFFRLSEEISERDLLDLAEGAAELIRRGAQAARWWSVENLLGDSTMERWRADVHDMRESDRRQAERRQAEARREEQHRRESAAAPRPQVQDLALARTVRACEAAWRARMDANARNERDEADYG